MKITKGTLLNITHSRKGTFKAIAYKDFDTDEETWYPVTVAQSGVRGMLEDWFDGEKIPCRNTKVTRIVVED